jgi:hypothetical protein
VKRIVPILLCVAMHSSPALASDDFCATIEQLSELAYDDFEQADDDSTDPQFLADHTSPILPGFDHCDVLTSEDHRMYWCSWPSTRQAVSVQAQTFINGIADCLDSEADWIRDDSSVSAFIEQDGVEFYVGGNEKDGSYEIDFSVEFVGDENDPPDLDESAQVLNASAENPRPHLRHAITKLRVHNI